MINLTWLHNEIVRHDITNPITSKEIEFKSQHKGSEVRNAVRELRRNGVLIGIISNKKDKTGGYYSIKTEKEFNDTIENLQSRVNSINNTIFKMKKSWFEKTTAQTSLF